MLSLAFLTSVDFWVWGWFLITPFVDSLSMNFCLDKCHHESIPGGLIYHFMLARQCALVTLLVRMIFLVSRGKKNTENLFVFFHDSYAAGVRTFFSTLLC